MRFTVATLAALIVTATAFPWPWPEAAKGDIEARASSNCTEYCSTAAGCVCRNWPANCSAFYTVQPDDTCLTIAKIYNNFTVTQLYKWNPDVGQTCFGLQAYVPVCINTPGYEYTPPIQPAYGTHYTPAQTPVPIMPGIISTCKSFELVKPGTTVAQLATENKFNSNLFPKWNGNSTTAWASYWACVKA